jgi:hypothetical protein
MNLQIQFMLILVLTGLMLWMSPVIILWQLDYPRVPRVWDNSHCADDYCDAVWSRSFLSTFRKDLLLPSSRRKTSLLWKMLKEWWIYSILFYRRFGKAITSILRIEENLKIEVRRKTQSVRNLSTSRRTCFYPRHRTAFYSEGGRMDEPYGLTFIL